ncbi:unnamed protein product [Ambrosiozyma monospora]|uniref:Small ribosomal subunit protein mS29 n=1 Tax=Ambrosiozyma monospora TaxID=43982 RepID=A0A9W7DD24_AMBMO|nr:unnamed protein product [Ambrosiozyma monospora]
MIRAAFAKRIISIKPVTPALSKLNLTSTLSSTRQFSNTSLNFGLSFSKTSTYDKSKKKGSGRPQNFANAIVKSNYKKKSPKDGALSKLSYFNPLSLKLNEVVKYEGLVLRKLYIAGAFVPGQMNELFPEPTTLIRERETKKLASFYESSLNSSSELNRLILTGDKGIGKSTALAQFEAMALSKESVLIPFTNTESLVDGSTDFKLNPETKLYDQQMSSKRLLKKLKNLNKEFLNELPLSKDFIPIYNTKSQQAATTLKVSDNATLLDLVKVGLGSKPTNATFVLTTLLEELSKQTKYPVYLTVDNFSTFVQNAMTKYRNNANENIYFQKFTIIKTILDFVTGASKFAKGAVVVATHGSDKENCTIPAALGDAEPDYYASFKDWDQEFTNLLRSNGGLQQLRVGKLSVDETESILKNLIDFNVIHNQYQSKREIDELGFEAYLNKLAQRQYVVSGNGNASLLLKSAVLSYV